MYDHSHTPTQCYSNTFIFAIRSFNEYINSFVASSADCYAVVLINSQESTETKFSIFMLRTTGCTDWFTRMRKKLYGVRCLANIFL